MIFDTERNVYVLRESDILTEISEVLKRECQSDLRNYLFLESMHLLGAYKQDIDLLPCKSNGNFKQIENVVTITRDNALMIIDFIKPD